jgi:hypothetical protein
MRSALHFAALAVAAGLMSACAGTDSPAVAEAAPAGRPCVQTTGSNLCRKSGSGANKVETISAETIQNSGGARTGPTGGTAGR